jgi:hypothetical protein
MDLQLRTVILKCELPKEEADELNHASGQVYTQTKNEHYRIYRKHKVWLTAETSEHVLGIYGVKGAGVLHSHSIDAAQQAFYEACKNARAAQKAGYDTKYPKYNKYYRPTIWKNTGLIIKDHILKLSRGRQRQRIAVSLPPELHHMEAKDVGWCGIASAKPMNGIWSCKMSNPSLVREPISPRWIWVRCIPSLPPMAKRQWSSRVGNCVRLSSIPTNAWQAFRRT